MTNGQQAFNPNEHLMKLGTGDKAKDYLPVAWRLVWFREQCPDGTIETELLQLDLDRETEEEVMVWNDQAKRREKVIKWANGFCIFRALAALGYGTQFTDDELEEGHRSVESAGASASDDLDLIKVAAKKLKLATNAAEWSAWKKQVFGRDVADQTLTPAQKSRLRGAIEQAMRQPPTA